LKTIFYLVIVALVVNACVQGSLAAWEHYQLVDAVEQETRFGSQKTTSELHQRVVQIGQEFNVPLTYNDVSVSKRGQQTQVAFSYVKPVELVPRLYTRQWTYDVDLTVQPVRPIAVDDSKR
jgi:hypothetical protein